MATDKAMNGWEIASRKAVDDLMDGLGRAINHSMEKRQIEKKFARLADLVERDEHTKKPERDVEQNNRKTSAKLGNFRFASCSRICCQFVRSAREMENKFSAWRRASWWLAFTRRGWFMRTRWRRRKKFQKFPVDLFLTTKWALFERCWLVRCSTSDADD